MDSQRRLLLLMVLSVMIVLVVQRFFGAPMEPGTAFGDGGVSAVMPDGGMKSAQAQGQSAPLQTGDGLAGARTPTGTSAVPVKEIKVARTAVRYTFSSLGGGLVEAELLGEKMREQQELSWTEALGRLVGKKPPPARQMNLAEPVAGKPLPLSIAIVGDKPFPDNTHFVTDEDLTHGKLLFHGVENGWEVNKTFSWTQDGFELGYQVTVKNVSGEIRQGELAVYTERSIDASHEEAPSMFGGVGNQAQVGCSLADEYKHVLPNKKPPEEQKGLVSFFGIDQQYFLTAVFPVGGAINGRCVMMATESERASTGYFPIQLKPGETFTQNFGVFMGPKDTDLLSTVPAGSLSAEGANNGVQASAALASPHLERTVDYGWWAVICKLLLVVLKACHRIIPNWGLSIMVLTIIVRLLLAPLNHKMVVGQMAMQKLQPKIEALKKKYPDDKERQQMEMMKIYGEAGVSPFSSCLPVLVQMPIWIALFRTLRNSYEIYREPFFGPIWTDLTYKDPTFILPLLLGISQVITTRMTPQTMDPQQAKIMNWMMPIMFTAFMLNYPMGLTLYIFASNVVGVAQQYTSRKLIAKANEAKSK